MTTAGRFVWHDLQTRDRAKALTFYQELLGWETNEIPLGPSELYGLCRLGGTDIAGVATSQAPPHVPSYWLPYLAADDLDAKVEEAKSLGARIIRNPADTSDVARSAVVADPRGALFGLRTQRTPYAAEPAVPPEGSFCWNELLTDDPAGAATFYSKLFGYSIQAIDLGQVGTYRILGRGSRQTAGVMKHPENVHPHWLPYLAVHDVDAATERALELGASLYFPARNVPDFGRFSAIDDPTGAGVCLFRGTRSGGS